MKVSQLLIVIPFFLITCVSNHSEYVKEDVVNEQDSLNEFIDSLIENFSGWTDTSSEMVDLSIYEEVRGEDKVELIQQLGFDFEFLMTTGDDWANNVTDDFHFFDLENDGDLDAIYNGWSGGEPSIVSIYLNVEGEYKRVFNEVQYLTDFKMTNNALAAISIADPGCCDAYVRFDEDFLVHS